jgi:predicted transposase YbfD/YdcC
VQAFADVPDPRRAGSVRYPLPAMLALAVSALLANHHSVLAIAEWGARQTPDHLRRLGFVDGDTPCQSTLQRLFHKLDGGVLAQRLAVWFQQQSAPADDQALQGVAIDGKAQRGRLVFAADGPVHVLSAFCHETGIVLGQLPVTVTTTKAEAELTVAPALLGQVAWPGRVLTGDALFCQRNLCHQVRTAGGDYVLLVKENQPALHEAISQYFDPPPALAGFPRDDWRTARTIDTGHGRRPEVRELIATTDLTAWSDWPGLAQVFRVERTWRERGQPKRAVHYGITSLPPERSTPAQLLTLKRGHWLIENRLHWRKDVTFGEDASLIHAGQGPLVMAALRDAVVSLLHHHGISKVASQLRSHSQHPDQAIAMVLGLPARA